MRLWDKCKRYPKPHYRIHLSEDALSDIRWWHRLLSDWNGKSFFLSSRWTPTPDIQLFTDASGTIGWGACYGNRWLHDKWSPHQATHNIVWKVLYAIAAACASWGDEWQRMRILVYCDNEAVVACLTSGTSRSPPPPPVMSLLRDLFHICALFGFMLSAKHIPGVTNKAADALSRFDLQGFRRAVPTANPSADKLKPV